MKRGKVPYYFLTLALHGGILHAGNEGNVFSLHNIQSGRNAKKERHKNERLS